MNNDLALRRMQRLSEEAEEHEAQLLQLAAQGKLYLLENRREPETMEILAVWVSENLAIPLDPYKILTREEIAQVWEDAEDPARQSY